MNVIINEAGKVYITMTSYPTEEDSDGDGYADGSVDILNNGKYNDPNPLVSNVTFYTLDSKNYVSIDNGNYYGGNQGWFSMSNTAISESGCSVIAATDLLIYLERNKGYGGLTSLADLECITIEEYMDFAEEVYGFVTPPDLGAISYFTPFFINSKYYEAGPVFSPIYCNGVEKYLRNYGINADFVSGNLKEKNALSKIINSIENDIPVAILVQNKKLNITYNGVTSATSWHWMMITEVVVDSIGGTEFTLASWGKKYSCKYLDTNDTMCYYSLIIK